MNPVVGIDIAKEESEVQAFLDKGKPYGTSFSIKHNREELEKFICFLGEMKAITGQMPIIILESTGHYHTPVVQCLAEEGNHLLNTEFIIYINKNGDMVRG